MSKNLLLSLVLIIITSSILSCGKSKTDPIEIEEKNPYNCISGRIKSGSSLYQALRENGIADSDAYQITHSLNVIYDLRKVHPNDSFLLQIDTLQQVQIVEFFPDNINHYIVQRDTTNQFISKNNQKKLTKETKTFSTSIESSLYNSFVEQGIDPKIVMDYTDIFQWDLDFFIDPRKGDSCKIIYEVFTNNSEILKNGKILSASYLGKNFDMTAYYFTNGAKFDGYYDSKGKSFQKAFLKSPLNYSYISSYYGMRVHPITKRYWLHNGVDYAAKRGTPVQASADGVIIHQGWKGGHPTPRGNTGGYGKTIMIRHPNGHKTLYGHLSAYAKGTYVGKRVKQQDIIGFVGSTGWSTGPHLHYTIYYHNKAINPLRLKNVSGPPIPKKLMLQFNTIVNCMNDELVNNYSK